MMSGPSYVYIASHLPPVVAYLPGLLNGNTSLEGFTSAVEELAKLSVVAEHIVGWPGLPFAARWSHLHDSNGVMLNTPSGVGWDSKPHIIPWTYVDRGLAIAMHRRWTLWTSCPGVECLHHAFK